jgi:hypothetical protein
MSVSDDIIADLKQELSNKISQRETILDQLQLADVEIDGYDKILRNMDREVLKLTEPITKAADKLKNAYDDRIESDCKTDLIWEMGETRTSISNLSGGLTFTEVTLYEVVKNIETEDLAPYHGLKIYQKPSNNDYGSKLVTEFKGNIDQGSSILAVDNLNLNVINKISQIRVGDTITDSISSPSIFDLGDLPEVIGTGSTDSVGIITSLVGGVISGESTFYHFGAGSLSEVTTGMVLIPPVSFSPTGEVDQILQNNTTIVGFETGVYPVEYYDDVGSLTTSFIPCNTLVLNVPALESLEEGDFNVGIITNFQALFISTISNQNAIGKTFFTIRTADRENIDSDFDPTTSPNSPVKITAITSENLGVGSSSYYDSSGFPSEAQLWKPESEIDKVKDKSGNVLLEEVKEPEVGAGLAPYNKGTKNWPIISTYSVISDSYGVSYAPLGTKIWTSPGSLTIGYANQPSGGFPGNCNSIDSKIDDAKNEYEDTISKNSREAKRISRQAAALRFERSRKENVAFSLLQAASSIRQDIERLQETLRQIDRIDFKLYES